MGEPKTENRVCTNSERYIRLDPREWWCATWRKKVAEPKPAARPFNLHDLFIQIGDPFQKPLTEEWLIRLQREVGESLAMTPEEGHFWFAAMANYASHCDPPDISLRNYRVYRKQRVDKVVSYLKTQQFDGKPSLKFVQEACQQVAKNRKDFDVHLHHLMFPALAFLRPEEVIDIVAPLRTTAALESVRMFKWYVLPYLPMETVQQLGERLADRLKPELWSPNEPMPAAWLLAPQLGLQKQIRALVELWHDDFFVDDGKKVDCYRPKVLIFGLGDPDEVQYQLDRLKLKFDAAWQAIAWIAHHEYDRLDRIYDALEETEDIEFLHVLERVEAPQCAPYMVRALAKDEWSQSASNWLETFPQYSLETLISSTTARGKVGDRVRKILHNLKRKGLISEEKVGSNLAAKFAKEVAQPEDSLPLHSDDNLPQWWHAAAKGSGRKTKMPNWMGTADFPPITLGERRLTEGQMDTVIAALIQSDFETGAHPLVSAIAQNVDKKDLHRFVWGLFQTWLDEGAPPKDKWALMALGFFGSDKTALDLAPLIKAWPGESQHKRAVLGLQCLQEIGTDTALLQINSIAHKVKFKGLKEQAQKCMEGIAASRGLSSEELEDRIIDHCGLDEKGKRCFDFGARQFHFVLGPELKPMVRDENGRLKGDLPAAGVKDDAKKAADAIESWKLLKQQIKEVAKLQVYRLEQAMITGRSWNPDDFGAFLVRHPFMRHLVKTLVWGEFDAQGSLIRSFRVSEDADYADINDRTVDLGKDNKVRLVHPLLLSDQEKERWRLLFAEYEMVQAINQLNRPIHTVAAEELEKTEIEFMLGLTIPGITLVSYLEKQGWLRGAVGDAGTFDEYIKRFPAANCSAVIRFGEGITIGAAAYSDDQEIENCFFLGGLHRPDNRRRASGIPLKDVDHIVYSEIMEDLLALKAKSR